MKRVLVLILSVIVVTILTACGNSGTYKIVFEDYDKTILGTQEYKYNDDITDIVFPSNPVREGYVFLGWDIELPNVMPANDIIISALYEITQFTISFNSMGGEINGDTQVLVNYNESVTLPLPIKEGFTFLGWFDGESSNASHITNSSAFKSNLTLYAKWQKNIYTISFNSNGGSSISEKELYYQDVIIIYNEPTRDGYIFDGWYIDSDLTQKFTLLSMPAEDITLYAKWLDEFTVLLDYFKENGKEVDDFQKGIGYEINMGISRYSSTATGLSLRITIYENKDIVLNGLYIYSDRSQTMEIINFHFNNLSSPSSIYYYDYGAKSGVTAPLYGIASSTSATLYSTGWSISFDRIVDAFDYGTTYSHESLAEDMADLMTATLDNYFEQNSLTILK